MEQKVTIDKGVMVKPVGNGRKKCRALELPGPQLISAEAAEISDSYRFGRSLKTVRES